MMKIIECINNYPAAQRNRIRSYYVSCTYLEYRAKTDYIDLLHTQNLHRIQKDNEV